MRGYREIVDEFDQGVLNPKTACGASGERASLPIRSRAQPTPGKDRRSRNILVTCILAVLVALAALVGLSTHSSEKRNDGQQLQQEEGQQGREGLADVPRRGPMSVYESSLHAGARLDRKVIPSESIAVLPESCEGDHPYPNSHEDEDVICPGKGRGTVVVKSSEKLQKMLGFGGAFTDAATINFFKLPSEVQDKVMDAYFGPDGIEYTVGRIPMGSCDFGVEQYSFAEVPGDYNMSYFDTDVEKDAEQRIPMIYEALKRQENLKLFISPWSPPKWMKVPVDGVQSMIESATPEGLCADPRVHAAWALYFSKFITAYKEQGIDMWGLTIQNESENPGPWEACVYTPSAQADFIRDYLGPVIRRDHPDVKIMPFDHNRDHLITWTKEMMRDEETSKYVDGMAFHWYFGGAQRLLDGAIGWNSLDRAHHMLDDAKFILSTENCHCPGVERDLMKAWARAERTAHDMIGVVNSWSVGWVDWNLLLSYDGGPNHVGNFCDCPILCNEDHTDVHFQPMFFFMGHVSKFAKTGARRLKSHVTGHYREGGMTYSSAVPGYEATTYGCEGSVRQSWELTASGMISLQDRYGAQQDWFRPMCVSRTIAHGSTESVYLVPCDSDEAGEFVHDPETGRLILQTNISYPPNDYPSFVPGAGAGPGEGEEFSYNSSSLSTPPLYSDLCLDVLGDSTDYGAVLTLEECGGGDSQVWIFQPVAEESVGGDNEGDSGGGDEPGERGRSLVSGETGFCVTAGWPFFTGTAFEMNEESKQRHGGDFAVVLLNEAEETVDFDLSFPSEGFSVRATIGPRSIQTIVA